MATDVEQIETIRTLTLAKLAEVHADPAPMYSFGTVEVSWQDFVETLERTVDWCDARLAGYQPFEMRSEGVT